MNGGFKCLFSSTCYKTFFGWNLDFPKIKNLKKSDTMSEPAQPKMWKMLFLSKTIL